MRTATCEPGTDWPRPAKSDRASDCNFSLEQVFDVP